jgi:hypothetical protein
VLFDVTVFGRSLSLSLSLSISLSYQRFPLRPFSSEIVDLFNLL